MSSFGLAPSPAPPSMFANVTKGIVFVLGIAIVAMAGLFIYNAVRVANGQPSTTMFGPAVTTDQTPAPVDGKKGTIIPAGSVPLTSGSDFGIQYWMFIQDWDYKFGQEKNVLIRTDPTNLGVTNPKITLHPTDNSLNVSVSVFGSSSTATASSNPAPANAGNATGDLFTCTVENVPLQSWFSVSVTVFQRNLDVYINGKLVKSAVLPGVPRPAVGDILVAPNGGFSGSICNVHSYPNMLGPNDTAVFFAAGTNCASSKPASEAIPNTTFMKIFGYTFQFNVLDGTGKKVRGTTF